jgi:hypothetical protein
MRLLKGGKVLGPEWRDFFVYRNVLITPEGHRFEAGELAWWSLLVRRAKAFGEMLRAGARLSASEAAPMCGASNTAHLSQVGTAETAAEGSALGLVCSETSHKGLQVHSQKQGVFGALPPPAPRGPAGRLARAMRAAGGAR